MCSKSISQLFHLIIQRRYLFFISNFFFILLMTAANFSIFGLNENKKKFSSHLISWFGLSYHNDKGSYNLTCNTGYRTINRLFLFIFFLSIAIISTQTASN